jgi:ABC-type dipeptide/oligopeptide/nickel transport system permease component
MLGHVLKRGGSAVITVWLAATIAFFAVRLIPGDAIEAQLTLSRAAPEMIEVQRARFGLDTTLFAQYITFLSGLAQADLGISFLTGEHVTTMIAQAAASTAILGSLALLLASAFGVALGLAVLQRPWRKVVMLIIDLTISMPIFWTATLGIMLFAIALDWLPAGGTGTWRHLILPIGLLAVHTAGPIARLTMALVDETVNANFVKAAEARGLRPVRIHWRHILPVAAAPIIRVIALQGGFLLSGTVIIETVFLRPGLGRLLLDSVVWQDYPVVQGIVIVSASIYVIGTLCADIITAAIDPRIAY